MSLEVVVNEMLEAVSTTIIKRANITVCTIDRGRTGKFGHNQSAIECINKRNKFAETSDPVSYK